MLDNIVITDHFKERASLVEHVVSGRAKEVEVILMEDEGMTDTREKFRSIINELLEEQKDVMVIFNCVTGVRGGVVETLREAEETHGKGTRRILVSCFSSSQINKGFKKRGVRRDGIRHIKYDEGGHFGGDIEKLFTGRPA